MSDHLTKDEAKAALRAAAFDEPDGLKVDAPIHLTAENAWKLADQLRYLVRNHYQGGDPEWLQTYGGNNP